MRLPRILVVIAVLVAPSWAQQPEGRPQEASVPLGDPAGLPARADHVERHGFTWRFAKQHDVGTFVNGDPWVVGPVQIVEITPASVEADDRVMHGSMLDPDPSTLIQGYDSDCFGEEKRKRYDAALNVGWGVSAEKPLEMRPGSSLVSVKSRVIPKGAEHDFPRLQSAAVLTCLAAAPAPDAFRPPYVRGDKAVRHRAVDLDFTVLQRVAPVASMPPIDVVARSFERLWLDHFPEWVVRYSHPLDDMPDYGRDIAAAIGSGALALQLDVSNEQKRELFVRLVQIGIDLHGALRGGCKWQGVGGHGSGRKLPILLAGKALGDERMLAIGREFESKRREGPGPYAYFAEDGQTFYVRETTPGVFNDGNGSYTRAHEGLPEWGFSHVDNPEHDDANWDANPYRRCCSANGWVGHALVARMMGLREAWHHDAFFDYMDRYMQVTHSEGWHRAWIGWHALMWDAYRATY